MKAISKGLALLALVSTSLSAGPAYYLFDGDASLGYQIDPGAPALVNTFTTFLLGYPVAIVGDKIRLGHRDDGLGAEYTLGGTPTGVTFTGGGGFSQLLDGTTDGAFNYAVECCGGTNSVMRADLLWQGGIALFDLPDHAAGITYDSLSNTLWVGLFDNTVHQYTLGGVDLGSFSTVETPAALAYEAATDTLWHHTNGGSTVTQYSKAGALIQTVTIPSWSPDNIFGGEIDNAAVPEPGTLGLLGLGLLAGIVRRFKK